MSLSHKNIEKLGEKRYRTETGLFVVEGEKNIRELLASDFEVLELLGTTPFLNVIDTELAAYETRMQCRVEVQTSTESALTSMGTFMSNCAGLAVAKQKTAPSLEAMLKEAEKSTVLILDDIRDPGNFGTIIRTADWFGFIHIIASPTTVDFYNSKVITASMGSFTRAKVLYTELETVLEEAKKRNLPILTADMNGQDVHKGGLPQHGLLVMGSESHGVSELARKYATTTIAIPRFGEAESLNVSIATGILLDSLRR